MSISAPRDLWCQNWWSASFTRYGTSSIRDIFWLSVVLLMSAWVEGYRTDGRTTVCNLYKNKRKLCRMEHCRCPTLQLRWILNLTFDPLTWTQWPLHSTCHSEFQEINSFGWYHDTVKNSSITTKHLYLVLLRSLTKQWFALKKCLFLSFSYRRNVKEILPSHFSTYFLLTPPPPRPKRSLGHF